MQNDKESHTRGIFLQPPTAMSSHMDAFHKAPVRIAFSLFEFLLKPKYLKYNEENI